MPQQEQTGEEWWRREVALAEQADGRPIFAKLPADVRAAIMGAAKSGTGKPYRELAERLSGGAERRAADGASE